MNKQDKSSGSKGTAVTELHFHLLYHTDLTLDAFEEAKTVQMICSSIKKGEIEQRVGKHFMKCLFLQPSWKLLLITE